MHAIRSFKLCAEARYNICAGYVQVSEAQVVGVQLSIVREDL